MIGREFLVQNTTGVCGSNGRGEDDWVWMAYRELVWRSEYMKLNGVANRAKGGGSAVWRVLGSGGGGGGESDKIDASVLGYNADLVPVNIMYWFWVGPMLASAGPTPGRYKMFADMHMSIESWCHKTNVVPMYNIYSTVFNVSYGSVFDGRIKWNFFMKHGFCLLYKLPPHSTLSSFFLVFRWTWPY